MFHMSHYQLCMHVSYNYIHILDNHGTETVFYIEYGNNVMRGQFLSNNLEKIH